MAELMTPYSFPETGFNKSVRSSIKSSKIEIDLEMITTSVPPIYINATCFTCPSQCSCDIIMAMNVIVPGFD